MIRDTRERIIQTVAYELAGLVLVVPFFAAFTQSTRTTSLMILCILAALVMAWSAIHNTVFDYIEWRFTARLASDRSALWRVIHAVSLELTAVMVTLPVLIWTLKIPWTDALILDLSITVVYIVYSYIFHQLFDLLRPVRIRSVKE